MVEKHQETVIVSDDLMKDIKIKNLMGIVDYEKLRILLSSIEDSLKPTLVIKSNGCVGVHFDETFILKIDKCRCGNAHHNIVGVVRDLLNLQGSKTWTRNMVKDSIVIVGN